MKAFSILLLVILAAGCSTPSKFANDPRAYLVGPDYLDYIAEYPRDRDTQYYYPLFSQGGLDHWVDPSADLTKPSPDPAIAALAIEIPPQTAAVRDITGKGWSELEAKGVPISAKPNLP